MGEVEVLLHGLRNSFLVTYNFELDARKFRPALFLARARSYA